MLAAGPGADGLLPGSRGSRPVRFREGGPSVPRGEGGVCEVLGAVSEARLVAGTPARGPAQGPVQGLAEFAVRSFGRKERVGLQPVSDPVGDALLFLGGKLARRRQMRGVELPVQPGALAAGPRLSQNPPHPREYVTEAVHPLPADLVSSDCS